MSDFVYFKSAKAYIAKNNTPAVKVVEVLFDGEVVTGYELFFEDSEFVSITAADADLVHSDILGIPRDLNNP